MGLSSTSKTKNLINTGLQHMMHGYIYDKDGNLVLEKGTEAITRKEIIEAADEGLLSPKG